MVNIDVIVYTWIVLRRHLTACANSGYQALFSPSSAPGFKASLTMRKKKKEDDEIGMFQRLISRLPRTLRYVWKCLCELLGSVILLHAWFVGL